MQKMPLSDEVMYRSTSGRTIVFSMEKKELFFSPDGKRFFKFRSYRKDSNNLDVEYLGHCRGWMELHRNGNTVLFDGEAFNKVVYRPTEIAVVPLVRIPWVLFERPSDGKFLYVSRIPGSHLRLFIGDENGMRQVIGDSEHPERPIRPIQFRNGTFRTTLETVEGKLIFTGRKEVTGSWNGEKLIACDPLKFLTSETEQGVQISV